MNAPTPQCQTESLQVRGIHVLWGHIRVHRSGVPGDLLPHHRLMFNFLIAKFLEEFLDLGIGNDCQSRHIKSFGFPFTGQGHLQCVAGGHERRRGSIVGSFNVFDHIFAHTHGSVRK